MVKINEVNSLKHIRAIFIHEQCIHVIYNFDSLTDWLHTKCNSEHTLHTHMTL